MICNLHPGLAGEPQEASSADLHHLQVQPHHTLIDWMNVILINIVFFGQVSELRFGTIQMVKTVDGIKKTPK